MLKISLQLVCLNFRLNAVALKAIIFSPIYSKSVHIILFSYLMNEKKSVFESYEYRKKRIALDIHTIITGSGYGKHLGDGYLEKGSSGSWTSVKIACLRTGRTQERNSKTTVTRLCQFYPLIAGQVTPKSFTNVVFHFQLSPSPKRPNTIKYLNN